MVDPAENLTGNTYVTPVNTESTSPGIEAIEQVILCAVTKRENKPGTPKETTLDINQSSTSINMNIFTSNRYLFSKIVSIGVIKDKFFKFVLDWVNRWFST